MPATSARQRRGTSRLTFGWPSLANHRQVTPALRPIIEACRAIEREAEPAWREALSEHAGRAEAAKAVDELWRENVRKAAKEGQPPPDRPSEAQTPQEPPRPRLVAMDATTEELQRMLSGQPRGLLYVR